MPETIDARGLTCPVPSDLAFQALFARKVEDLLVLADDPASGDHLERLASQLGYELSQTRHPSHDEYRLRRKPAG